MKLWEIKECLVNEQEYTEDEVDEMSVEELVDLYQMYTENEQED